MGRWLVTSAWPYINYMPHLGTIIGSVLSADVAARYLRLKGEEVLYVSGSDEHGTPIELEAVSRNISPKELTDENHVKVKKLFQEWMISYDNYTRTENPTHKTFVQNLLLKIYENGYIFTQETEFPYCPRCSRFLPDRFIQGECPKCGFDSARGDQCDACGWPLEPSRLINPRCTVCGSTPQLRRTKHWYFDLPKLSERLQKYIEENKHLPINARNFSLNLLKEGLKPRPITRDSGWGIPAPFPDAQGKTIYVWVEAVLGYISAVIEYFKEKEEPERWRDYWLNPEAKTIFFIGKDNIPFHTIILPALLMATGEPYNLPWTVNSTEFLMFEGQKFSKSRRIGIWIDEALQLYPADYWRYTLLTIRPETKDTNFTLETFLEKVNSDLNDTLGNFIHRTLTFIDRYFKAKVPRLENPGDDNNRMLQLIDETRKEAEAYMAEFRLQAVTTTVMKLAHSANKYINDKEPWKKIKTNPKEAAETLHVALQTVKALAIMLEPLIPQTAINIRRMLNVEADLRWDDILKWLPAGHPIGKPKPLFKKVSLPEDTRKD